MSDVNEGVIRPHIIWREAEVIKVQKETAKGSEQSPQDCEGKLVKIMEDFWLCSW